MKKINFFLIGMTSVLLAFAMIGCDNGTKVEYRDVPVGGNGGNNGPGDTLKVVERLKRELAANGTVYINTATTLDGELILSKGEHIVVGNAESTPSPSVNRLDASAEGPLFEYGGTPQNGRLNITAGLRLLDGSSLTVGGGAAVVVQQTTSENVLYVSKGAKVGVGVDVSNDTAHTTGSGGTLWVETKASVVFEPNAVLAVTTAPSSVVLEATDSGLTLPPKSKLAVVDGTDSTSVIGEASDDNSSPVIVIQSGATAVTVYEVDVYTDAAKAVEAAEAGSSAGVDEALTGTVADEVEDVSTGKVDVTEKYALSTVPGVNPAGLRATAVKDLDSGDVTITLTGEAGVAFTGGTGVANDIFWSAEEGKIGKYEQFLDPSKSVKGFAAVVLTNLVDITQKGEVKQINQALNMWNADTVFEAGTVFRDPAENAYKVKVYKSKSDNENNNAYYPDSIGGFDFLIWGGATTKTVTFEVSQPYVAAENKGTLQTFKIDYTAVTFTDATAAWELDSAATNTTSGISIKSATRAISSTGYVTDTIYLTGTATEGDEVATMFGEDDIKGDATGNFAIVTINDLFKPSGILTNVEYNIISPAWAYYDPSVTTAVTSEKYTEAKTASPWVYIDSSNVNNSFAWRKIEVADADLTLLLWDGATGFNPPVVKKATIEVKPPTTVESSYNYTVIVDWSGLTINAAATPE